MEKEVNDQNFKDIVLDSKKPVLVDFWASWCGPCISMIPKIKEIAEHYKEKAIITKMDIDKNKITSKKYNIKSIPTLLFFKKGKEIKRKVGVMSKNEIIKEIDLLL